MQPGFAACHWFWCKRPQTKPTNAIALNFNPVHSFWWCNLGLKSNLPTHWENITGGFCILYTCLRNVNIIVGWVWIFWQIETNWNHEHQNYAKNSLEEAKVNDDFAEALFPPVQMPYKYKFLQIHKYKTFCPQIKLFTSRKCKLAQH